MRGRECSSERVADGVASLFGYAETGRNSLGHQVRIAQARKLDEPHSGRVPTDGRSADFQRQACLANATRAGQRDQAVVLQELAHTSNLL